MMLQESNPLIQLYLTARERLGEIREVGSNCGLVLNPQPRVVVREGADPRRQNLPTADEVSMILAEEYGDEGCRDIVLAERVNRQGERNSFTHINPNHALYMPLHYVLFFPSGEHGWHWGRRWKDQPDEPLTQRVFYRFRLHTRADQPATLFPGQWLFQQFVVDAWAQCDQNKLGWIRTHLRNIRAELYYGLADILNAGDMDIEQVGKRVVLQSSYGGGDRFMHNLYRDSIAIVLHYGNPSLFITFTANPKWVEIHRELLPGQQAKDRPDLMSRAFYRKVQHRLNQIRNTEVLGPCLGWVWTIEYQKRGLPYLHLLLFLSTDHQFLTAANIDQFISAELPSDNDLIGEELRVIIQTTMVHTHCVGGNG